MNSETEHDRTYKEKGRGHLTCFMSPNVHYTFTIQRSETAREAVFGGVLKVSKSFVILAHVHNEVMYIVSS
jgi:hypothetical protein